MSFAAGRAFDRISPIAGAINQPRRPSPRPERLTARLDAKLAEIESAGWRVCWLEIGRDEMLTLFREGGEDAVRLDPDPARDCGWYGRYEVRYSGRELVWVVIEGELPGEMSIHIVD
jgi:hypothetical protein